jgi:hypothetical protein
VFMPPSWQPGTADELCSKRHVRQSFWTFPSHIPPR